MRKVSQLTCYCIVFCVSIVHSQKLPKTLLWRIDGNGLQKPSYLYGTMHLTDDRVFNLGDSLYKAIENSEGFAIEVNPEEMTAYLIDEISQQIKNAVLIKGVLSKKEFDEYAPALSKKLKKPADEITTRDIFLEKNKWVRESFQEGKMSTFLDAYLFDVARRLGKWTGGVEDMDDQKGLIDELVDESDIRQIATYDKAGLKGEADKFMQVYLDQNLNDIDSISNTGDSAYEDALLIRRNFKMTTRIDSMSKMRSMVFAIGAAHLPGGQGLIQLLQNKGYKLSPVFSSKKVAAKNYKVKEVSIPWVTINDPDSLYTVDMPGKPGDIEMYGLLKMKMYFDIFNSTGYMVTAVTSPYDKKRIDSIMTKYAVDLFKQKDTKKIKSITVNGISGREMEITDADGYKHGYILSKNNVIYIVLGLAVKKNPQTEDVVNKFLSSYQPFSKKENYQAAIYTYTDDDHLYSIDLPSKPQSANALVAGKVDKSVNTNLLLSSDNQTGAYFFIGVTKTSPGYLIENDSTSLRLIENNTKPKFTSLTSDSLYTDGEKRMLNMEGMMAQANLFAKVHYELIGNHWYVMMAMYDTSKSNPMVDQFFRSFKILTPAVFDWKQQSSEDGLITAWTPDAIISHQKDTINFSYSKKYESYDSVLGNTYDIMASGLGKYYWQNSDSALWNSIIKNYSGNGDSIISQREVTNGDVKGIELQIKGDGSLNVDRKRILLYGDTLYTLVTVHPRRYVNDSNVNKFFDGFTFNRPASSPTVLQSKAKQLLIDISDTDSATRALAQSSIPDANFSAIDIPILYEALLKTYAETSNQYETVNEKLRKVITKLEDSSSPGIAKEKYKRATSGYTKSLLLDIISDTKTKENYIDIKNLLLESPPDTGLSYYFINNVKDSSSLARDLIIDILPLMKDTILAPAIVNISSSLLDSNIISASSLHPYLKDILNFADYELKKQIENGVDYDYSDRFIIKLLGKLNTVETNAMLQKWLSVGDNYLKLICVEKLLENAQSVTAAVLVKLAADKSYRMDLYNTLKEHKQQNLFPKQYLSQQYFAESNVYTAVSDDSEPLAITFLSQKTFMFHGKQAKFFFYKITYGEDDDKSYNLACAGPYSLNASDLNVDKAYGYLYYKEDFDKNNLQQQMKDLIKEMEGEN
ncbi:MAG: TraB/GumN family protein [Ginsengibacter sp.]